VVTPFCIRGTIEELNSLPDIEGEVAQPQRRSGINAMIKSISLIAYSITCTQKPRTIKHFISSVFPLIWRSNNPFLVFVTDYNVIPDK